jgi:hypothetical protein
MNLVGRAAADQGGQFKSGWHEAHRRQARRYRFRAAQPSRGEKPGQSQNRCAIHA